MTTLSLTQDKGRIEVLDLWRGFALFGVCVVNFRAANGDYLTREAAEALVTAGFDWRMENLLGIFLANKAHTIFTFLFGIGFALILERSRQYGDRASSYLIRRQVILLVFGWLHFLLFYDGEILRRYALLGILLFPLARLVSIRGLFLAGLFLAFSGRLVYEERALLLGLFGAAPQAGGEPPYSAADLYAMKAQMSIIDYVAVNFSIALYRVGEVAQNICVDLYYFGRILMGYAFWASGAGKRLFACPTIRILRWSAVAIVLAAAVTIALRLWSPGPVGTLEHFAFNSLRQVSFLVVSAAYLLGLLAIVKLDWLAPLRAAFAAVGRMSLTNYVLQTIGMILIFGGPGLAIGGDVGVTLAVAIGVLFFLLQMAFSAVWLRRRSQGPLEHWWRRLAHA